MKEIAASITPICLFVAVALAIVAYLMAERFFKALLLSQPDLANVFKRQSLLISYGPISAAKFRYLNTRKFASLTDPELRRKGRQAYFSLAAYAVSFLISLLVILTWAASRGP